MHHQPLLIGSAALVVAAAPALAPAARDRRTIDNDGPPRYPVITEVYFNVLKGDAGDASGDGTRHAAGDEFIELWNPHDDDITLTGLQLVSRLAYHAESDDDKVGVRFTFPKLILEPDEFVVVFNGSGTRVPGNVGSPRRAHKKTNSNFENAWVFTTGIDNKNRSLSNAGDFVLLLDQDNNPIEGVTWGRCNPAPPEAVAENEDGDTVELYTLHDADKSPGGSVHRILGEKGQLDAFTNSSDFDGTHFSPGYLIEEADRPEHRAALSR